MGSLPPSVYASFSWKLSLGEFLYCFFFFLFVTAALLFFRDFPFPEGHEKKIEEVDVVHNQGFFLLSQEDECLGVPQSKLLFRVSKVVAQHHIFITMALAEHCHAAHID